MRKLVTVSLILVVFALSLSACGSKGSSINVTVTDFAYTPNTFTVTAGQPVNLTVKNQGNAEHEFAIMKLGTSVTAPFGDKDEGNIFWELDEIGPGTTKTGTFTAPPDPGTYEVVCGLPGHIEKGMTATLVVK